MFASTKRAALDVIQKDNEFITRMVARRCERRVREAILAKIPDWGKIKTGEYQEISASVASPYPTELKHFKELVAEENLDALVARYPLRESNVFDRIAKALKYTSRKDYEQTVVARVRDDTALAKKLRQRIDSLHRALEEQNRAPDEAGSDTPRSIGDQ